MIPARSADPHSQTQNIGSRCQTCCLWVFSCACLSVLFSSVSSCEYLPIHWHSGAADIQHPTVCMMSWQWGRLCRVAALEAASQVSEQSWYWQRLCGRHHHHQHSQFGPVTSRPQASQPWGRAAVWCLCLCPPCQSDRRCSCHAVSLFSAQWATSTLLMLGSTPHRRMQPRALGGSTESSGTELTRCVGQGS